MEGWSSAGDYETWYEKELLPKAKKDLSGQLTIEQMANGVRDARFDKNGIHIEDIGKDK